MRRAWPQLGFGQAALLVELAGGPSRTQAELAEGLGLSRRTVGRWLYALAQAGLVEMRFGACRVSNRFSTGFPQAKPLTSINLGLSVAFADTNVRVEEFVSGGEGSPREEGETPVEGRQSLQDRSGDVGRRVGVVRAPGGGPGSTVGASGRRSSRPFGDSERKAVREAIEMYGLGVPDARLVGMVIRCARGDAYGAAAYLYDRWKLVRREPQYTPWSFGWFPRVVSNRWRDLEAGQAELPLREPEPERRPPAAEPARSGGGLSRFPAVWSALG